MGRLLQDAVKPHARFLGTDPTGTITVTVDGRGMVQDVAIDAGWLRSVGPSALGDALMQAYNAGNGEAALAAIRNVNEALEQGALRARVQEPAPVEQIPAEEPSIEERLARVDQQFKELDELKAQLAELERRTAVSGPAGVVRIELNGGQIVGITVDRRPAAQMQPASLAAEAMSAFRAATSRPGGQRATPHSG